MLQAGGVKLLETSFESTQIFLGTRAPREGGAGKNEDVLKQKSWCGGKDSNLHGIATASPSSWCVCQFRHHRKIKTLLLLATQIRSAGFRKPAAISVTALSLLIVPQSPAKSTKLWR